MTVATKTQKRIQEAYAACYRLCENDHRAAEWLTRSLDEARREEVGHRKMGARFTRGASAYKLPIADAARFFAVKWFLDTQGPLKASPRPASGARMLFMRSPLGTLFALTSPSMRRGSVFTVSFRTCAT